MKFHENKRPFQCEICGKSFVLKQNLRDHEERHQKQKVSTIKCTECPQTFNDTQVLKKHRIDYHTSTVGNTSVIHHHLTHQQQEDGSVVVVSGQPQQVEVSVAAHQDQASVMGQVLQQVAGGSGSRDMKTTEYVIQNYGDQDIDDSLMGTFN